MLINIGLWKRQEKAKCMIIGVTGNVYRSQGEGMMGGGERHTQFDSLQNKNKEQRRGGQVCMRQREPQRSQLNRDKSLMEKREVWSKIYLRSPTTEKHCIFFLILHGNLFFWSCASFHRALATA